MRTKSTKIVIQFKDIPMNLYYNAEQQLNPNLLVIHIQPEEGITLHLNAKKTGHGINAAPVKLSFANTGINGYNTPESYEQLLDDCMHGDATNFTHWDEVALSWSFVDNISHVWESSMAISRIMSPVPSDQRKVIFFLPRMASTGGRFPCWKWTPIVMNKRKGQSLIKRLPLSFI